MQQSKQIIQLSDHVNNKIKSQRLSFSSDDEDDNKSMTISTISHRRSSTFVIDQIRKSSESTKQTQLCIECLRRENLLHNEHQENRKLSEQLRSTILLNQQYQEENWRLKQHLNKLYIHHRDNQMNFNLFKQKLIVEKFNPLNEDEQIRRLRHDLQVYNQIIRIKQQKHVDYFSQFRSKKYE